ncbi:MAG: WYL domain-containing protein [Chloroflexia bacterium]|nr:WYL domain-containing protein [Chloroflexia bacterium]
MRADRLLSILLLLQARGRMTARELAEELEVSERTIYRDIDALSIAGVPVYGEPGPEGGYALLDSYRTQLTGLTEGEARALFMLSLPAPLEALGVSQELRSALLKLSAALPEARRRDEERARQCFHLDSTWWRQGQERVPHLRTVHQAVWQDRQIHIVYRPPFAVEIERLVAPYGLVAKAGVWYLVCARNERLHVHRVSNLLDVRLAEESFERPAGFDLASFWEAWCAEYERFLSDFRATVRVAPDFVPELARYFGHHVQSQVSRAGPPDAEGWIQVELSFESFEAARDRLLGFGRGVEVLEPRALQRSVLDFAEQIVDLYSHRREAYE